VGHAKTIDFRQLGLLLLVIIIGLGLTFSATRESVLTAEQQAKSDFNAQAKQYADHLQNDLQAGLTAAQDIYDYYDQSKAVSRDNFLLLVRTNSNLNRNRKFVSLTAAFDNAGAAAFEADMNARVYGGSYRLWQPETVTPADGTRLFPLVYTWAAAEEDSRRLSGLNIGAHPAINSLLETINTSRMASAVLVPAFLEMDGGAGGQVLLANPFITKDGDQSFLVQLLDIESVLASISNEMPGVQETLTLSVQTDWGDSGERVAYGSNQEQAPGIGTEPYVVDFSLGSGNWKITISEVAGAYPVDYGAAMVTASVCLLLTGLFFFIVYSQLRRAQRVADIVSRRTRALKEAHDELEEHYKLLQNLNKDVEESRRTAEMANRAKSEFLATMSHELRTPLNAILGFSQLLSEQALGPIGDGRYIEYSKDIHSSGSHLLSLINDILDLAKLEAGKVNIEKNVISSHMLTERVVTLLSQQAENKGIELQGEYEENMPDRILGDELRLRQILINLCSNAIKFTHEGSVVARLFSKPFQNGREGYIIEVQDTGIGIPDEKQATLFDRFTQVDAALSRRHGGVGLGLAICRELVDRMEGRISVRSMPNVGTAIRVHLPLELASVEDEEDDMII
jgi:signal transduction histidine kinase